MSSDVMSRVPVSNVKLDWMEAAVLPLVRAPMIMLLMSKSAECPLTSNVDFIAEAVALAVLSMLTLARPVPAALRSCTVPLADPNETWPLLRFVPV